MRTAIPNLIRRVILQRTHCDNSPHNPAIGCKEYICPLWKCNNGMFDESGKEIDHIIEVKFGGTNELKNLQVLCPCCHSVKTKRCAQQRWDFNSCEIENGMAHMEEDRPKKRKRANSE